jgi:uncharacterized coiled-coil protein SlyX
MAKTLEQLTQEALGAQQFQILKLAAQLDALREELDALKAKTATPPAP